MTKFISLVTIVTALIVFVGIFVSRKSKFDITMIVICFITLLYNR